MDLRKLSIVFLPLLAIECFANAFEIYSLQFFSKPSLMLVLIVFFVRNSENLGSLKNLIVAALIFSWIGDVLLLIEKSYKFLFLFGLISFLVAHICYVIFFWQIGKLNRGKLKLKPFALIGVFSYMSVFYWILYPNLSEMALPVLVYSSVISLMLLSCLHAFDSKNQTFAKICIAGTILFAFSDSLIALNRFVSPIPFVGVLIMLAYAFGQLLITEGAIRNLRQIDLK